jgi:hypothetical protein
MRQHPESKDLAANVGELFIFGAAPVRDGFSSESSVH